MSQKTLMIIKAIIAVVLIAAIGTGLFFGGRWAVEKIDSWILNESTHNDDGTTKLPGGSNSDTTTPETTKPTETAAFYINEETKTGYSRLANVTFFFKVIEPEERFCDLHGMVETPTYLNVSMKSYGMYDINMRYSYDGQIWSSFGYYNEETASWEGTADLNKTIYVSYTSVTDCANPSAVLEELNVNVFTLPNMFTHNVDCLPG